METNLEKLIDERDGARRQRDGAIEDAKNKQTELEKLDKKHLKELDKKDKLYGIVIKSRDTQIADLKSRIIKLETQGGDIPMNKELIWDSIKAPLRQALLVAYAFIINQALVFVSNLIGFEFTPEQKVQIIGYGTPLVWWIISMVDRFVHKVGKVKGKTGILGIKGLAGF